MFSSAHFAAWNREMIKRELYLAHRQERAGDTNSPVSHSAHHQCPAMERHKIRIVLRENVDNQTPRNTNFTH